MEYEMKGGFLCPRRAVRQGGGHHHLVPTSRTTCIYLPFRFIHTTRTHRPPPLSTPPRPYTARVVCPVLVPPLLSRFCMRGEQPRRTVADVRKGEEERERERERKFREACGDGGGR